MAKKAKKSKAKGKGNDLFRVAKQIREANGTKKVQKTEIKYNMTWQAAIKAAAKKRKQA